MVKDKTQATLKEEIVDDALAAVKLVRKHEQIDPKRVFVLGHSLGGMVAPRIGQLDPAVRGLIMLAANSRPLEDLILDQHRYQFSLDGGPTKEQKAALADMEKQVARVKDPKLAADSPAKDLPLGVPAPYWLALKAYDQKSVAAKIAAPLLILQGERDYQVTLEDFAGWKKALAGRKGVTFKSYPRRCITCSWLARARANQGRRSTPSKDTSLWKWWKTWRRG